MEEKNNTIEIGETIIVRDLAEKLDMASGGELITKLIGLGVMANQNQAIDFDMVSLLGEELGFNVVGLEEEDEKMSLI